MKKINILLLLLPLLVCSCNSNQQHKGALLPPAFDIVECPKTLSFASEPMPLDSFMVREWLTNEMLITQNMHSSTFRVLLNSKRYFSIIEPILKLHGVPSDFKYLAVAESALNPEAYSPAKAAGIWQQLASTAREYGLEVNSNIDERYNVEKSTHVACEYFLKAYEKFGSWTLVAASYNMGMTGLSNRIESQGQSSFYSLALPVETMRYIYRIASYKVLFADPQLFGYTVEKCQYYSLLPKREVEVRGVNINWIDVAAKNGANYRTLRLLNPWIRDYEHHNRAKKSYKVKLEE